ncbi:hypothetical protein ACHAPU_009363 [Fusarium lateritium]
MFSHIALPPARRSQHRINIGRLDEARLAGTPLPGGSFYSSRDSSLDNATCCCLELDKHKSILEYLSDNSLSDITVKCHGRRYYAHRNVLCSKCPFFDKAMNGPFKEAMTGIIELPEDNPDILETFLEWKYCNGTGW